MGYIRIVVGCALLSVTVLTQPASQARAFIGDSLACAFDETSTGCIAKRISGIFRGAPAGRLKDRSAALLSYSWARRGQKLFSESMEKASKDQRFRAYAAVISRSALGDFKTARRAIPYIRARSLWLRALWMYAMAAIRRGNKQAAARALPGLLRQQAKVKSPISRVRTRCRIAMVQARLGDKATARKSLADIQAVIGDELPGGRSHEPLVITCIAARSVVEGRQSAGRALIDIVSKLQANKAVPSSLKMVFLAQAAEQWARLGEAAKSRALGETVLRQIANVKPRRQLVVLEYLLFASFRTPAN